MVWLSWLRQRTWPAWTTMSLVVVCYVGFPVGGSRSPIGGGLFWAGADAFSWNHGAARWRKNNRHSHDCTATATKLPSHSVAVSAWTTLSPSSDFCRRRQARSADSGRWQSPRPCDWSAVSFPQRGVACAATVHGMEAAGGDNDDDSKEAAVPNEFVFQIRDCTHAELGTCADIIMTSFYNETSMLLPWKQLHRLAELNRLQQGFPFGDDHALHCMLIATTTTTSAGAAADSGTGSGEGGRHPYRQNQKKQTDDQQKMMTIICGFVDVDARIPNRPTSYTYNPRPYLSDLCVHPDFRRRGLARALVQACEDFCRQLPSPRHYHPSSDSDSGGEQSNAPPELYIRVEATNTPASNMYRGLGYSSIPNPDGAHILILRKVLERNAAVATDESSSKLSLFTNVTNWVRVARD